MPFRFSYFGSVSATMCCVELIDWITTNGILFIFITCPVSVTDLRRVDIDRKYLVYKDKLQEVLKNHIKKNADLTSTLAPGVTQKNILKLVLHRHKKYIQKVYQTLGVS